MNGEITEQSVAYITKKTLKGIPEVMSRQQEEILKVLKLSKMEARSRLVSGRDVTQSEIREIILRIAKSKIENQGPN